MQMTSDKTRIVSQNTRCRIGPREAQILYYLYTLHKQHDRAVVRAGAIREYVPSITHPQQLSRSIEQLNSLDQIVDCWTASEVSEEIRDDAGATLGRGAVGDERIYRLSKDGAQLVVENEERIAKLAREGLPDEEAVVAADEITRLKEEVLELRSILMELTAQLGVVDEDTVQETDDEIPDDGWVFD